MTSKQRKLLSEFERNLHGLESAYRDALRLYEDGMETLCPSEALKLEEHMARKLEEMADELRVTYDMRNALFGAFSRQEEGGK